MVSETQAPAAGERLSRWAPLAITTLAVLLYLNILPNTFIYDDWQQIFQNPFLRYSGGLKKIFLTNVWGFLGSMGISNYYRPLMHATFYATFHLFGYNPAGYHALSILLHALNSLLVYALLARLTGDLRIAAAAGLLFAAHPIHTENVCWISGYPDLEAALFFLLAWWLYLEVQSPRSKVQSRKTWISVSLSLCYFLGLLAKEIVVAVPVMLLAYEFLVRRAGLQQVLQERWREYLGLTLASVLYLGMRFEALGGLMPYRQSRTLDPEVKFLTNVALFYRYWAKILWPAELNVFHYLSVSRTPWEWPVEAGAAAFGLFLWAAYRFGRTRSPEALAFLLFLVTLAPAFTLPYGDIGFLMGERYLYLPSVGFCWLAAFGLARAADRWGWKPAAGVLAAILVAYSARTVVRNLDWRYEIPFYEKSARMSPNFAEVYTNLGEAYLRRNLLPQALAATQRAVELRPRYPEANNNLGQIYSRVGQPEKAIEAYRRSAEYSLEAGRPAAAARAYTNTGYEYRRLGKYEEAIRAYHRALELDPEFAGARNNLGYVLALVGRPQEAEQQFLEALREDPALAVAHSNLGLLYAERGDLGRAEQELSEAARLEPRDGETYARLGDVARARGDRARAEALFRQALSLQPDNPRAMEGLKQLRK